jgi:ribosome biogenesis GTPase / thiamine phosphate phosphatase
VPFTELVPFGWSDRWAALFAALEASDGAVPGRVVRHEGTAVNVALPGDSAVVVGSRPLRRGLDPSPVVGDWVAERGGTLVAVLPRASLLERRDVRREAPQPLAANVDVVLVTCGVDRPVKDGRIQRTATLAWDAGAVPVVVLTKVDTRPPDEIAALAEEVTAANPGLDVLATSASAGLGLDELRAVVGEPGGSTVVLLGESGAGKSSLVNVLLGEEAEPVGPVRRGDAKGRHTTTTRQLHVVPSGGTIIDTPGIRAVGLWADAEAVASTFDDIDELALDCRFADCGHATEPGCAVLAAVEDGRLAVDRLESWRALEREAAATERRADPAAGRRYGKATARIAKDAQRRKGRH